MKSHSVKKNYMCDTTVVSRTNLYEHMNNYLTDVY